MNQEFEDYVLRILPQVKETYPKAKEREAFGELRRLYAKACKDLSPFRRFSANSLLFPPRLTTPFIYWPSAPGDISAVFQTDIYWVGVGISAKIPNPDLTQQRRTVLQVGANGVNVAFSRKFNPQGDNYYRVSYEMGEDSPLRKHPDALTRAVSHNKVIDELNGSSTSVLEFLEYTASFINVVCETNGFRQDRGIALDLHDPGKPSLKV